MEKQTVLIMEFSEHCNQLIARFVRDEKVYCEIVSPATSKEKLKSKNPIGIILTGAKVTEYDKLDGGVSASLGVPVLKLDGHQIDKAALHNFLFKDCKAEGSWTMAAFAKEAIQNLKNEIGDKKVLCALSGGVDSTVVATLIHEACPNLLCVYVDTGLMRKNESDEVVKAFKVERKMNLVKVDAEERFLKKLKGVIDPEQKRKIIGEEFIRVFEEEAKKIGKVDFLAQGTIYPDLIESGIGAKIVKSHHNVGGLPSVIDFKELVEPVKDLFKDEVRALGFELGLPKELVMRQPFPGPGLGVRVIGEVTKEKLDILREADYIFRDEIAQAGLDTKIWQYFAVMTGLKSVGMRNGGREYEYVIALRAIHSVDAMAAEAVRLPYELLEKVSLRINNEVQGAGRVVYDITNKPPATIEWE